jgi:hypothetical protein
MASTFCLSDAPPTVFDTQKALRRSLFFAPLTSPGASSTAKAAPQSVSWQSRGLTLQSLYGLASSLCAGDIEITPVQAWFEMAAQYPPELLLSGRVLAALKREFVGVVKCIHFGAIMEREAFESVVVRVMEAEAAVTVAVAQ